MVEHERLSTGQDGTQEGVPDWWPYGAEFPRWHIWRGVSGLFYGRRLRTSPPIVVRADTVVDLRDQVRRAEGRMA